MINKSRTSVNIEPIIPPPCSNCEPCDQHLCTCILDSVNGISNSRNLSLSASGKGRVSNFWLKNVPEYGLVGRTSLGQDLQDFHSEHLAKQHAKQPVCRPRIHQVRKKKVAPARSILIDVALLRNVQTVQELFLLSAPFSPSSKEPP
jgi:hypothetical protein